MQFFKQIVRLNFKQLLNCPRHSVINLRQYGLRFQKSIEEINKRDLNNIEKRQTLPLREIYREGFTHEEVKDQPESVQRVLRMENALPSTIMKFRKKKAMEKYQKNVFDTGTISARVVALTENMYSLVNHCQKYRKDAVSHCSLGMLIDNRRRQLWQLRLQDYHVYRSIIKQYNISDTPPKYHHHKQNFRGPSNLVKTAASGRQKKYDISTLWTEKQLIRKKQPGKR